MIGWERLSTDKYARNYKFGHADTWYIHKPEFVKENETHKILWYFEMQMIT